MGGPIVQRAHHQFVLLVKDNRQLSKSVGAYLEDVGYEVDYAMDGVEALRYVGETRYNAIVLDVGVPSSMESRSAADCARSRATLVLMLTARDTLEDKVAGLQAGADDYLTKPFATQELDARLKVLTRREQGELAGSLLEIGDLSQDVARQQVRRGGRVLDIPPIGIQIPQILMRAAPGVVSRRDIEQQIRGTDLPDSDTLRSHSYILRKIIDKPFAAPRFHTYQGFGFRMADWHGDDNPSPGIWPGLTRPHLLGLPGAGFS
jgi:DNA-binding response OmpR family regulator